MKSPTNVYFLLFVWITNKVVTVLCQDVIEFVNPPKSQAVLYGDSVMLDCEIKKSSPNFDTFKYSWNLNGGPRPTGSAIFFNHSILLPNIQKADLGNYTCAVSDGTKQLAVSPPAKIIHAYLQPFFIHPAKVQVTEGETITLDCVTGESAPPPHIYWEKDGKVFNSGLQYNVTFNTHFPLGLVQQFNMKLVMVGKPYHTGEYNCVATNSKLGISIRSRQVPVGVKAIQIAPRLDMSLYQRNILTPKDQPFMLNCPVVGFPEPVIKWQKGQTALTDVNIQISNGSLYFKSFQLENEGYYICEGSNVLGSEKSLDIIVQAAYIDFEFVTHPSSLYAIAGRPITIPCSPPKAYPAANVTWYKNNQPMKDTNTKDKNSVFIENPENGVWNLFIADVQKVDEGQYFCVAENLFAKPTSRTSKVATLKVGGAPTFVQPPRSQSVIKGQGLTLVCIVQGDPVPDVAWFFNGNPITDKSYISTSNRNRELNIANINKGWEGYFTCRANNSYGKSEATAYISIKVPAVITSPMQNLSVTVGNQIVLPCVVYGDPIPNVTWYKDVEIVQASARLMFATNGLIVNNATLADSGLYRCLTTNGIGSAESSGTLTVLAPPSFEKWPQDSIMVIGSPVTLPCSVTGYPDPVVSWQYNDTSKLPNAIMITSEYGLYIRILTWQHVGKYTCVASNSVATKSRSALVKLQVPPTVKYIQGDLIVVQNRATTLTCNARGIPIPDIHWIRLGNRLQSSSDGRIVITQENQLLIKFAHPGDAGDYTCAAINAAGKDQSDVTLHIIEPPLPPGLLNPVPVSSFSIKLKWVPVTQKWFTPVSSYVAYFKERHELTYTKYSVTGGPNEVSLTVHNLRPGVEYIFVVAAVNQAGEGSKSNSRTAKTLNADPSSPRNLHTTDIQPDSVTLQWEIPAETNGIIQKYQIWYQIYSSNTEPNKIDVLSPMVSHTVTGLLPYTDYQFSVRASTVENDVYLWGNFSSMLAVQTKIAAPSGTVMSVEGRALSATSVEISWKAVPADKQNGPILKYYLKYRHISKDEDYIDALSLNSSKRTSVIDGLQPWNQYSFIIIAENVAGKGPASYPVEVRTLPAAPSSAPTNIKLTALSGSVVNVQFKLPDPSSWNGELSGIVVAVQKDGEADQREVTLPNSPGVLPYNISGLEPWTLYNIRVALYTSLTTNGTGPWSEWRLVQTLESVPGPIQRFSHKATPTSIALYWSPPLRPDGIIQLYHIQYYPAKTNTDSTETNDTIEEDHQPFYIDISNLPDTDIYDTCSSFLYLDPLYYTIIDNIFDFVTVNIRNNSSPADSDGFSELLTSVMDTQFSEIMNTSENLDWNQTYHSLMNLYMGLDRNEFLWIASHKLTVIEFCQSLLLFRDSLVRLNTTDTRFVVDNLQPSTPYVILMSASNSAGPGNSSLYIVYTDAAPPPPPTPAETTMTEQTTEVSTLLSIRHGPGQMDKLPVILGGAAAGAVLILFIMVLVLCICIKRKQRRDQIIYETRSSEGIFGDIPRDGSLSSFSKQTTAAESNDGENRIHFVGNAVRYGTNSTTTEARQHGYGHMKESQSMAASASFPGIRIIGPEESGIENPSYRDGPVDGNSLRPDRESIAVSMSLSAEEVYSRASTLQRKSRMKKESAEAIAVMRNSNIPIGLDDTESLIPNDSVVVYAERTAL